MLNAKTPSSLCEKIWCILYSKSQSHSKCTSGQSATRYFYHHSFTHIFTAKLIVFTPRRLEFWIASNGFCAPRLFTAWVKFTPPYRDGSQYQPRKREQKCDRNHPLEDKWLYRYICFLQSIYFRYQRLDRRCQFPIWSGHLLRPIQFACYLGKAKCLLCRYE